MNLNENISRIKELMGVHTLNEQSDYMMDRRSNALMNATGIRSDKDYKNVEKIINKAQNPYKEQIVFLNKIPSQRIERVALLFPQGNWYEELGSWLLDKLGIVSGWFRSLAEALGYVKKLEQKGVVTNQLVVGSHGSGGQLLITQKEGNFFYDNQFLLDIKKIIDSKTSVFFTACEGADYLEVLKDAAEKLGVGVYGASGIYNYVTQSSENGFYWCSSKPINQNLLKQEMREIKPMEYYGSMISVNVPITNTNGDKYIDITGTIRFKNNSLFGIPMTDINFPINGDLFSYNELKKTFGGVAYEFYIQDKFKENFPKDRKDKLGYYGLVEKIKKIKNLNLIDSKVFKQLVDSNLISIELNLPTGKVNIKNLKPFMVNESISNSFLLQNKYCMKVNKPPINWIDEVLKNPSIGLISPALGVIGTASKWLK